MSAVEWITPRPFIYLARRVLGEIDLDPASSEIAQRNVEARTYYTPDNDGLEQPWRGRLWLSPPQGRGSMATWTGKLIDEYCAGRVDEAIALVPNDTDTAWYHRLLHLRLPFTCKTGRISFESTDRKAGTPAQGQTFFYFGDHPERFREVFSPIGYVFRTIADCRVDAERCARERAEAAANHVRAA